MRKLSLKSASFYLDEAAEWSRKLTMMRARGPGDTENAMRSIERDYGVDYWFLWRLRYRKASVRDVGVSVYLRIQAAYQAECERQMRKLQNEISFTSPAYVAAAAALVREVEGAQAMTSNRLDDKMNDRGFDPPNKA